MGRNGFQIALLSISLIGLSSVNAEIQIAEASLKTVVKTDTKSASVDFVLKNIGHKTIKIQRMEADCSCVTMGAKKTEIPPSKELIVKAVFEIGKRKGEQKKKIVIFSDDPRDSVVVLNWTIQIPETH